MVPPFYTKEIILTTLKLSPVSTPDTIETKIERVIFTMDEVMDAVGASTFEAGDVIEVMDIPEGTLIKSATIEVVRRAIPVSSPSSVIVSLGDNDDPKRWIDQGFSNEIGYMEPGTLGNLNASRVYSTPNTLKITFDTIVTGSMARRAGTFRVIVEKADLKAETGDTTVSLVV